MTILDELAGLARERVRQAQIAMPLTEIRQQALALPARNFAFEKALKTSSLSFICEVKKASPSKGLIAPDFPYLQIAREYEQAGAACISVLTEPYYFKGDDRYVQEISREVSLPVLRKDFTVDAYMIYQAALMGASAVLLICALLDTETIREYIGICDTLGLSALVETHDEQEVQSALAAGARVIGVNNRNLKDFTLDISNCIRLRRQVPQELVFVAESGIRTSEDIVVLREAGVDAVLIGETLMRAADKKAALSSLRGNEIQEDV